MQEMSIFYYGGKIEGIITVLQKLYLKDGFSGDVSKEYIIKRLTELYLSEFVEEIVDYYFSTENSK